MQKDKKEGYNLDKKIRLIDFALGREWYSLEIKYVQEIVKPTQIYHIPGTPDFLLGAINHRGTIITVTDIARYFNIGSVTFGKDTRIIIVRFEGIRIGIIVDSMSQIFDILEKDVEPPLSILDSRRGDYILGECNYNNKLIVILDLPQLLRAKGIIVDC